jgi:hypothetical protein
MPRLLAESGSNATDALPKMSEIGKARAGLAYSFPLYRTELRVGRRQRRKGRAGDSQRCLSAAARVDELHVGHPGSGQPRR